MPEGDTIHRLSREFGDWKGTALSASSPQGRFVQESEMLEGQVLESTSAKGKHLFLHFSESVVHIHLGLYGRVIWTPYPEVSVSPSVRLRLTDGSQWSADLIGPNTCETVDDDEHQRILERLGPDPLRDEDSLDEVIDWLLASPRPIGELLLAQGVISGIGNVYRAELLFRSGTSPFLESRLVPEETWRSVWDDASMLMSEGVSRGGIVTRDEARATGKGTRCYVYRRTEKPCFSCGGPVATDVLGGRRLYWCPECQR